MTYKETINYLYTRTPLFQNIGGKAYKEGLDNTLALDEHFGHPHREFATIHIAGTNGKGSCSHTIASILQEAGYRVGLFTSPHLLDFRERIRINGEMIPEEYVTRFVEEEKGFFEPLYPSFFELTTAMAFKYFRDSHVDIAVIEVGLGGRLDCTNIIRPLISVITNISFDHTQFLGHTLADIAREKAGITKRGIPVIIGEALPETESVFRSKADDTGAPIYFAEANKEIEKASFTDEGGIYYMTKHHGEFTGALGGLYQIKNANTILTAIDVLNNTKDVIGQESKTTLRINDGQIRSGFQNVVKNTGLLGRWQTLCDKPKIVCDTGHNVGGFEYLSQQIKAQKADKKRIVIGMVNDKDIDGVMSMLPAEAVYYFCQPSVGRAMKHTDIKAVGSSHGLVGNSFETVAYAFKAAVCDSTNADFIYVGGSSFVVADLLKAIQDGVCTLPK